MQTGGDLRRARRGLPGVALLGSCLAASALPALLLAEEFARPGHFSRVFLVFWCGVLLGPFSEAVIYGAERNAVWLAVALPCLLLMLAYPVRPNRATACLTATGFAAWYLAGFLVILNREAPV